MHTKQYLDKQATHLALVMAPASGLADPTIDFLGKIHPGLPCFTLHEWLQKLSQILLPNLRILSREETYLVWHDSVNSLLPKQTLSHTRHRLIEKIQGADEAIQMAHAPIEKILPNTADREYLLNASRLFEAFEKKHHCLRLHCLVDYIRQSLCKLPLPKKIYLYHLTPVNASEQAFLTELSRLSELIPQTSKALTPSSQYQFDTESEEVSAISHWLRDKIIDKHSGPIAILVPKKTQQTNEMISSICQTLYLSQMDAPQQARINQLAYQNTHTPLLAWPVINTIMTFFQEVKQRYLTLESWFACIKSNYLNASFSDQALIAQVETYCYNNGIAQCSLNQFKKILSKHHPNYPEATFPNRIATLTPDFIYSVHNLSTLSTLIEYPNCTIDEASNRALSEFYTHIDQLDHFSATYSLPPIKQSLLKQLFRQTSILPLLSSNACHYITASDCVSAHYNEIWCMNFNASTWPLKPQYPPLLSRQFVRDHLFAQNSASSALELSTKMTHALLSFSKKIYWSTSITSKAKEIVRISPLLAGIPTVNLPPTKSSSQHKLAHTYTPKTDEQAPTIPDGTTVSGGTRVLSDQATCPFKAFAQHRLKAFPLERLCLGLSKREQGILIHDCLEKLWETYKSYACLHHTTDAAFKLAISKQVDISLEKLYHHKTSSIYIQVEKKRLLDLLFHWFVFEKKSRSPFHIHTLESSYHPKIGSLHYTFRVDRIDQLATGEYALIDYKSGQNTPILPLLDEHVVDLQLPIYACYTIKNINLLAFAEVKMHAYKFKGLGVRGDVISGIIPFKKLKSAEHPSWQSLIDHWRKLITDSSESFQAGIASVRPFSKKACQFCALKPLCRIPDE